MDKISKITEMPKKNQQKRPPTRSNVDEEKPKPKPKPKSTISKPANQLVWVKKEPANSAPSNQTHRVKKELNPALLTQSVKKESRNQTQWVNKQPANYQWVKKEPANPASSNNNQVKNRAVNSAPANQTRWVKKERENSSSEVSSSKNVIAEKATRKTQRFSAKEKGKAKVEETQDLGTGKEIVIKRNRNRKNRNRKRNRQPRAQDHIQRDIATILEEENMQGGEVHGSCIICEHGLGSSPSGYENQYEEEEYDYYYKTKNLPEVGVLGCGHCYHTQCLEDITPDDLITDPPCLICLS